MCELPDRTFNQLFDIVHALFHFDRIFIMRTVVFRIFIIAIVVVVICHQIRFEHLSDSLHSDL